MSNNSDLALILALKALSGGGGEPAQYLKSISKDETNKTITITAKNGTQTTFPYGSGLDFLSLERLGLNTYKATFDTIPSYNDNILGGFCGGCTSFVKDEKVYTNLDWKYDNDGHFWVITKDFEGLSFIAGLEDGALDFAKVGQLPYHINRGRNNDGIIVSSHVLFNDFSFEGTGTKENKLTLLPYHILNEVHSITELSTKLSTYLANLQVDAELLTANYLMQFLVSDGTTTYVVSPKTDGSAYEIVDITALPKLTNFKWLNKATLQRNDADLQDRPTGIERWNLIEENKTLEELKFSLAYESNARLSEWIGENGTTKLSTDAELQAIYEEEREKYLSRTRDGETWITCHSAVYGSKGLESLYTQENYNKNYVSGSDYDDSELRTLINGKVNKSNGTENANKVLKTDAEGDIYFGDEMKGTKAYIVNLSDNPLLNSGGLDVSVPSFKDTNGNVYEPKDDIVELGDNVLVYDEQRPNRWVSKIEKVNVELPDEYQQLHFIRGIGAGERIDTGVVASGNLKMNLKCAITSELTSGLKVGAGCYGDSKRFYFLNFNSGEGTKVSYAYDVIKTSSKILDINKQYEIETKLYPNAQSIKVDGELVAQSSNPEVSLTTNICLFDTNTASAPIPMAIYRCKIWKDDELIRDFVPCRRKSDNVAGLYDIVNNQFYANDTPHTFIGGDDYTDTFTLTKADKVDLSSYYTKSETNALLDDKQDELVSGTNIKTINSQTLLGEGDIVISGGSIPSGNEFPENPNENDWFNLLQDISQEGEILYYKGLYQYIGTWKIQANVGGGSSYELVNELPNVDEANEGKLYLINRKSLGTYDSAIRDEIGTRKYYKLKNYMGLPTTFQFDERGWYSVDVDGRAVGMGLMHFDWPVALFDIDMLLQCELSAIFEEVATQAEGDAYVDYIAEFKGYNILMLNGMTYEDIPQYTYAKLLDDGSYFVDASNNSFTDQIFTYYLNNGGSNTWTKLFNMCWGSAKLLPANDYLEADFIFENKVRAVDYNGASFNELVGILTEGSSLPTERPDGTPLQSDDYVIPSPTANFPLTIGSMVFTRKEERAIYVKDLNLWEFLGFDRDNVKIQYIACAVKEKVKKYSHTAIIRKDNFGNKFWEDTLFYQPQQIFTSTTAFSDGDELIPVSLKYAKEMYIEIMTNTRTRRMLVSSFTQEEGYDIPVFPATEFAQIATNEDLNVIAYYYNQAEGKYKLFRAIYNEFDGATDTGTCIFDGGTYRIKYEYDTENYTYTHTLIKLATE